MIFRKRKPKYQIGDIVRFVDESFTILSGASVYQGRIWKINNSWLWGVSYEIFHSWLIGSIGDNYTVSESAIIELIKKGK